MDARHRRLDSNRCPFIVENVQVNFSGGGLLTRNAAPGRSIAARIAFASDNPHCAMSRDGTAALSLARRQSSKALAAPMCRPRI